MHIHLNLPSVFKSVPTNFRSIGWLDTEFIIKYIVVGIFKYTMGNTAMLCNIYGIMDILFIFVRYSLFSKGRRVHKNMKKGKKNTRITHAYFKLCIFTPKWFCMFRFCFCFLHSRECARVSNIFHVDADSHSVTVRWKHTFFQRFLLFLLCFHGKKTHTGDYKFSLE